MSVKAKFSGRFGNQDAAPEMPVTQNTDSGQEAEAVEAATTEDQAAEAEVPVVEQENTIDEDKFLEFYRNKTGRDIKDISELSEPKKESPKYDDDTRRFLTFQERNKGTMQDWIELNKDWDKVNDIELVRQREREETGLDLSNEELDALIKDRYGLDDFDNLDELEGTALVKLKADAHKYRNKKKSSREELFKSLDEGSEAHNDTEASQRKGETITLTNGQEVDKEVYLAQRKAYEEGRSEAIEKLNESTFSFKTTSKQGEVEMKLNYAYTGEDKQKMLAKSEDTSRIMESFIDENNNLKHGEFNEGLLWADKKHRESVLIPRMIAQAFSMGQDSVLKEDKNIDFSTKRPVSQPPVGSKIDVSKLPGRNKGFGPRFTLNKKK